MSSSEPADLRVVPDTADEWLYVLGQLEELLLTLALWEDDGTELPDPLAGRAALRALGNLYDAISPTRSRNEVSPVPGRILAPEGRYEHMPIRFVRVAGEDLSSLEHAAQVLMTADGETPEAIDQHAEERGVNRSELAGSLSRLISVVGLAWDDNVRLLWSALEGHAGQDVVLSADEEEAYKCLAGASTASGPTATRSTTTCFERTVAVLSPSPSRTACWRL
jgi:hypothetical protein